VHYTSLSFSLNWGAAAAAKKRKGTFLLILIRCGVEEKKREVGKRRGKREKVTFFSCLWKCERRQAEGRSCSPLPFSPILSLSSIFTSILRLARAARRAGARVGDGPTVLGQGAPRGLREPDASLDRGPGVTATAEHGGRQRRRHAVAGAPVGRELPQLRAARQRGLRLLQLGLRGVDRSAVGVGVFRGVGLERVLEPAAGARAELGSEEGAGDGVGWGWLEGWRGKEGRKEERER